MLWKMKMMIMMVFDEQDSCSIGFQRLWLSNPANDYDGDGVSIQAKMKTMTMTECLILLMFVQL